MKVKMNVVKKLREKTGRETADCKMALEMTLGDYDVAYEFLMLTNDETAMRFHDIGGILVPWFLSEYVEEATRIVIARQKKEIEDYDNGRIFQK